MKSRILTLAFVLSSITAPQMDAAFVSIDDSDLNTFTITVGDFEGGFSLYDGTTSHVLNAGIGQSASMTFADSVLVQFYGRWIDLGQTLSNTRQLHFGDVNVGVVQSIVQIGGYHDGSMGSFFGYISAYDGAFRFPDPLVLPQDGHTEFGGFPYLSWSVTSEDAAHVPDSGSTLALVWSSIICVAIAGRRLVR